MMVQYLAIACLSNSHGNCKMDAVDIRKAPEAILYACHFKLRQLSAHKSPDPAWILVNWMLQLPFWKKFELLWLLLKYNKSSLVNWVTEMRSGFTPLLLKLRETLLRLALLLYIFSSVNVDPTISLSMCHVILNMKTPHIAYACRRVSKGIRCFSSRLSFPF